MTLLPAADGVEMCLLWSPSASHKMEVSPVWTRISGLATAEQTGLCEVLFTLFS